MSGAAEFDRFAVNLGKASIKVATAIYEVYKAEGENYAEDWAANARATSGEHGRYYPDSIDSETHLALGVEVEVGANSGKKQGRMGRGFELGSQNQPPHLDGLRALPVADARLARTVDTTVSSLLP